MHINFHISLITKRFFRSFDRHSDETVTLIELLLDINNFSNKIVDVIRKSHEFRFAIVRVITIVVWIPLILLQMLAYDVRALTADTRWRHDFPPSCCWAHLPLFFTPWSNVLWFKREKQYYILSIYRSILKCCTNFILYFRLFFIFYQFFSMYHTLFYFWNGCRKFILCDYSFAHSNIARAFFTPILQFEVKKV